MSQAVSLGKRPHIIVASPGRLLDHLHNTKGFSLRWSCTAALTTSCIRSIKYLVLDEADKLLSMDFQVAIDKILEVCYSVCRHSQHNRCVLRSATPTCSLQP